MEAEVDINNIQNKLLIDYSEPFITEKTFSQCSSIHPGAGSVQDSISDILTLVTATASDIENVADFFENTSIGDLELPHTFVFKQVIDQKRSSEEVSQFCSICYR